MMRQSIDQFARIETTCGLLLCQLQEIWNEMGEPDDERDTALVEIEQECLAVYRRKVDEASRCKAGLLKAIAIGRAEIAAIGSLMGGADVHASSSNRVGENLKEELENVNIQLEEMRKKKLERKKQFEEVLDQLQKISSQLGRPTDYLSKLTADEMDLSHQKLEELHTELVELQNEKSKRIREVEGFLDMLNSLCSVLGKDFKGLISKIHPSLVDPYTKDVSTSSLDRLTRTMESLREDKIQRMEKLQNLAISLLELWNLLNIPMEEQKIFHNVTAIIAASESEVTETNILSIESIKRVEDEVMRLSKLKTIKIKELILGKKLELEEISRKMHMAPEVLQSAGYSIESIESGVTNPEYLLEQIDYQISTIKEEASSRKEILERVEKWMAACEEESWLDEYNRDDNRYNAGRGAHLTLKRAEKARILVNKLPGMVEALIAKVTAWEKERGTEFLYDGVRLLSMLDQYNTLRQEKELEKQRQRDLKKLQGQLIAEQEALYGSRPSPTKSGKKALRTPGAAINRKLSLGGAILQNLKPEKATPRAFPTRKNNFRDQNSTPRQLLSGALPAPLGRRNSEIPGRLAKKHISVAGKAPETRSPLVRKPLSPVPSNIMDSPEDSREAYSRSLESMITPNKFVTAGDEENSQTPAKTTAPASVPTTPATSVAMTMATTPATPAIVVSSLKTLEKRVEDVEYSFEEVRAGFAKPMCQA